MFTVLQGQFLEKSLSNNAGVGKHITIDHSIILIIDYLINRLIDYNRQIVAALPNTPVHDLSQV